MTTYYLFGESAVSSYQEGGVDNLLDQEDEYAVFEFTPETNPGELLAAYDGWNDYTEISQEEFKKLSE